MARKFLFPKLPSYNCTSDFWFTPNIELVFTAHSGVFYTLVNNVGGAKYSQIFLSISFPLSSGEQSHIITAKHFFVILAVVLVALIIQFLPFLFPILLPRYQDISD